MATTTSLIINSTDTNGKAQQKTITYLNPKLSNADMDTLAMTINAIGTATYTGSVRVDKTDLGGGVFVEDEDIDLGDDREKE